MNIIDRIAKNFAKNLEYSQEGKMLYSKLLSHFNTEYSNFQDVVDVTNYWIVLFLLHIDTILVLDSSNRMYFKPNFRNQVSDIFSSMLRKHIPVTQTFLGYRVFGKEYVLDDSYMSDLDVYITVKNLVTDYSDIEVFTTLIRACINDFSTKAPRFYRTEFPKWSGNVKYNHIDSGIEKGFLNYIRRGGGLCRCHVKKLQEIQDKPERIQCFHLASTLG